ncbi:TetR/AcrR family transcriptional regulator [Aminipila sp.]|uniref:TetR/AcrR family transcriptional regulator n=1 Tax=Aminipila sp. TaxID=2060095 RepID=UPI0028A1DC38|nr:TetR/AcrR family transcriptional regulator [Aminipila sp.]
MPKDKTASHERIIPAAKDEFLKKGFEKASMRSIASAAGMTSAGLYRHFADKEAMFAALIEPVLEEFTKQYGIFQQRDYQLLERKALDTMWDSGSDLTVFLDLIYQHFDGFKLLICCAEGTRYANFIHDFVMIEQKETMTFLDTARERGIPVKDIRPEELHLLLSAYASAIFEVVVHDFSQEDAQHYMKTLQTFFYPGWRAVLGL